MRRFCYTGCISFSILIILALLIAPMTLAAQDISTSANLTGTVTDNSEAIIPGAIVTVSGVDNGVSRSLKTDSTGRFSVPLLPPATYKLHVESKGFKSYEQKGISLLPGHTVQQDVQLTIGTETEEVVVTSEAALLNTGDANLSAEITAKQIVDLPLNLRSVISLATLNSSVSNTSESQSLNEGGTSGKADQDVSFLNFGGGFLGTSAYVLDGIWDTDSTWGAVIYVPTVEAVSEFKIQTNSFTSQTGFSTGNVVQIQTKSGTSSFHGDAFEFIRNSKLDANSYFNNANGQPKLNFRRNQFGASAGGPLYIPGLYKQRDKTFIFGAYEGLRQSSPVNTLFSVPTAQMEAGDFSQLLTGQLITQKVGNTITPILDPLGNTIQVNQLYNPFTGRALNNGGVDPITGKQVSCPGGIAICWYRDPFPNNNVSKAINPVGANLIKFYPAPTNGALANNFFGSATAPSTSDEYLIRVDHNISDATRIYVRWASKHEQKTNSPAFYGSDNPAGPGNIRPNNRYSIVTGFSHVINATTALSVNAGFHRWVQGGLSQAYPFDPTTLGLPGALNANSNTFPIINVGNGSSPLGPVQGNFGAGIANVGSVGADVTKSIPKHDLSFGAMDVILQNNGNGVATTQFSFQPDYTSQFQGTNGTVNGSGFGLASLLIGTPDSGGPNNPSSPTTATNFHAAPEEHYYGGYAQDNWKATKTLTVNLGLRYEVQSPFTERHNRQAFFNPTAINPISQGTGLTLPGEEVFSTPGHRNLYNTNLTNFAPRLGFTDQVAHNIVLRGGYGVFFPPRAFVGIQASPGFNQFTNYDASDNGGLTLKTTLSNPFPNGLLTPTGSSLGALTDVGNTASTGVPAQRHSPYVQQYSLGVQYAFTVNDVLTASYVGNRGTHMLTSSVTRSQVNPALVVPGNTLTNPVPNPFYGTIKSSSCGLDQPTVQKGQLLQPFPQYCGVTESEAPEGDSFYNALLVDYNHRFHGGLNLLVSYTFSKFIDDTGGTASWAYKGAASSGYRDSYNLKLDKSVDGTDQPHSLVVNYIYELPVGRKGKYLNHINRATDAVIGGWQVSGVTTIKSGLPLSISGGGNTNEWGGNQQPDQIGNPNDIAHRSIQKWFNTSAFQAPVPYTLGNTARYLSYLRSPKYDNWDASLQKIWELRDTLHLQGRAEFYNLPNHPNFFVPDTGINDGNFGQISQAFDAREIQFAMKLIW